MADASARDARSSGFGSGTLSVVYALYFITGATALVFEVLWTRSFAVVFGNSTYAMSVVLAAFMGGLGLGALAFGKSSTGAATRCVSSP